MATIETRRMVAAAAAACEDKKAEDLRILELDPADAGLADYFLIASGANERQTEAITEEIELRLKRDFHVYPHSIEGRRRGEWVLLDYVDFVIHVFLGETRAYYDLERLRKSARVIDLEQLKKEAAARGAKKKAAAKPPKKKAAPRKAAAKKGARKPRAVG